MLSTEMLSQLVAAYELPENRFGLGLVNPVFFDKLFKETIKHRVSKLCS